MTKQLLFYELATPIAPARHARWSVRLGESFAFAAGATTLPIMVSEFPHAAPHAPIVFIVQGDVVVPAIVTGIQNERSMFVSGDGAWTSPFMPAVLKRYPFVFSQSQDGSVMTLCIDEAFSGIDRTGTSGDRLFDDAGGRTEFLERVLSFVTVYQREHNLTLALGRRLLDLDLLEPAHATITQPDGRNSAVTGFHRVSREKLAGIDDARLRELFGAGALELVYLHLMSLNSFGLLARQSA